MFVSPVAISSRLAQRIRHQPHGRLAHHKVVLIPQKQKESDFPVNFRSLGVTYEKLGRLLSVNHACINSVGTKISGSVSVSHHVTYFANISLGAYHEGSLISFGNHRYKYKHIDGDKSKVILLSVEGDYPMHQRHERETRQTEWTIFYNDLKENSYNVDLNAIAKAFNISSDKLLGAGILHYSTASLSTREPLERSFYNLIGKLGFNVKSEFHDPENNCETSYYLYQITTENPTGM